MPLEDVTARAIVEQWRGEALPDWSDDDAETIAESLVALSAALVPLVVDEAELSHEQVQAFFRIRVTDELTDWLARAAAGLRSALGLRDIVAADDRASLPIGLRTASLDDLEALPTIGPVSAREIARMARLHPELDAIESFEALEDVGPRTREVLQERSYLDRPFVSLTSAAVIDFAGTASVPAYLRVLAGSDLELTVGDGTSLQRRPPQGGSQAARFLRLVATVTENARLASSVASGVLAEDAERLVRRRRLRTQYLAGMQRGDGQVLVNEAYVEAAARVIREAGDSVQLMVFLGTATPGDDLLPGPLELVRALEERAAAGLDVRVLLDQDDGGEPYRSLFINQPLFDRLTAAGVSVRYDAEDTLLHSKVLVVDRSVAVVGSHNWTRAAFTEAYELSVLVRSAPVAAAYAARFDQLWDAVGP